MAIREDIARELCRQALRADRGAYDKLEFDTGVLWPQFVPNANAVLALLPAQEWQDDARRLVDEQAKDEGLWFQAQTCAEAYVQTALRRLHAAVEGDKSVIFPAVAIIAEERTK